MKIFFSFNLVKLKIFFKAVDQRKIFSPIVCAAHTSRKQTDAKAYGTEYYLPFRLQRNDGSFTLDVTASLTSSLVFLFSADHLQDAVLSISKTRNFQPRESGGTRGSAGGVEYRL